VFLAGVVDYSHMALCLSKTFKVGSHAEIDDTGAKALGKVEEYPVRPIHGLSGVNENRMSWVLTPIDPKSIYRFVSVPT
jgi:hypothetical protein